jgi:hypothetical protein
MKKVILTGHSKGLGNALASALIEKGCVVLGISRSLTHDMNGLQQVTLDLADTTALGQWLDSGALKSFLGNTEQAILINNSGVVSPVGPLGMLAAADITRSIDLNVAAPLVLSNAFVEHTAAVPDRRILHISSGAGRRGMAGWSVYCATKAALDNHARAVHEDSVKNLRISSLAPGIVDTGMQADIRSCSVEQFPQVSAFQDFKAAGDLASPGETAAKIAGVLLSPGFGDDVIADVRDYQDIT